MAFAFKNQLDEAAERRSQAYFATLSEMDPRRFAALEAQDPFGNNFGILFLSHAPRSGNRMGETK